MRRTAAAVMAIALGVAACGGGDDDTAEPADEPAAEPADEPADEPVEEPADEPMDEPADEPSDGNGGSIGSLDDIPDRCKDLMADYLRDIEPIVAEIDWGTAVFSDFETIAEEIDERATEFDARSVEEGCDDLDFDDDDGLELLVEFADDVAPGTVPFFTFLASIQSGTSTEGDSGTASGGGEIETCDEAIGAIEDLMAEYDTFTQVPIERFLELTNIGGIMMTCTPEQLEFFDSPAVEEFLNG